MRCILLLSVGLVACGSPVAVDGGSGSTGGSVGGSSGGMLACTPTGGTGGLPWPVLADAGIALEAFPSVYFSAFCQAMANCYPMADYLVAECTLSLGSFNDFAFQECTSALCGGHLVQPPDDVQAEVRAVAAGRLSYRAQQAVDCLGTPWPLACDQGQLSPTPPAACQGVFVGTVGDGGACYLDVECEGEGCVLDAGCPGLCQPQTPPAASLSAAGDECPCVTGLTCAQGLCWGGAALGASCGSAFDCQPGFYCSPARGRTCQPQLGDCAPCTENLIESQDAWSGQCQPGFFCRGLASLADGGIAPGVCTPPLSEGDACVVDITPGQFAGPVTGCLPGLDCIGGSCALPPGAGACQDDDTPCLVGTAACFIPTGQCQPVSDSQCTQASCAPGLSCIQGNCAPSISPPLCNEP
jgi:hypothetical protein